MTTTAAEMTRSPHVSATTGYALSPNPRKYDNGVAASAGPGKTATRPLRARQG